MLLPLSDLAPLPQKKRPAHLPRCAECHHVVDGSLACPHCQHGPLCARCYHAHNPRACAYSAYE